MARTADQIDKDRQALVNTRTAVYKLRQRLSKAKTSDAALGRSLEARCVEATELLADIDRGFAMLDEERETANAASLLERSSGELAEAQHLVDRILDEDREGTPF